MSVKVTKDEVVAFRLCTQHLSQRLSEDDLLTAAGACGIQNSPPGSALLALHARVDDMSPERLTSKVVDDKSLLQSWSMRGAPFFFPTADLPVFTTGVLPTTEDAQRHFILGVEQSLDKLEIPLAEVVGLIREHIRTVLSGRRLPITELGAELTERVASELSPKQRTIWTREGAYSKGQPLGEGVVHFCLRILTLEQVICFAPRDGKKAPFVLVDEWLGKPLPMMKPKNARAELLRRYLHVYGPSTRGDFASWAGVRSSESEAWWDLLEDEMTEVDFGRRTWILTEDVDTLRSPPTPTGVRLLPPRDPYIQGRDRATIIDKQFHREVFKTVGEPGTVLVDGSIVGTWRPRKQGKTLKAEAGEVANLRGASSVKVDFASY